MTIRKWVFAAVCGFSASPLFAAGGIVTLDFGLDSADELSNLNVASNGRIFATVTTGTDGTSDTCGVYGLDGTGTLLSTFGSGGMLSTTVCPRDFQARSDGTFADIETGPTGFFAHMVFRDGAGAVSSTVNFFPIPGAAVSSGVRTPLLFDIRSDGKTVVGGAVTATVFSSQKLMVGRVNADGTDDTAFAGGVADLTSYTGQVKFVRALSGGKVLASGTDGTSTYVLRLNADGTLDATFGANGAVQLPAGPGVIALDSSGQIYVPETTGKVARLSSSGAPDGTYTGGTATTLLQVQSIAVDSQGRAVVFGHKQAVGYVARLDASGNPDATFNGTGNTQITFATDASTCLGKIHTADQPLLACTVKASGDTSRTDLAITRLTTAGVLDATFGVNQPDSDPYPDAFSFPDATAPYGTAYVVSQPVTITGINVKTSIAGNYSIGCTGTFTSQPGSIQSGDTVCMRTSAPNQPGASTSGDLLVGGTRGSFRVTADNTAADSVPDAFSFAAKTDVAVNTDVVSGNVTISGITGFATVTVTNGFYSVGCDPSAFRSASSNVANGAVICVRQKSAATLGTATNTTLTVGGVSATFTSTTIQADTQPNAFAFTDETNQPLSTVRTSNTVTISGINTAAAVSVTGGDYSIGCNGTFTSTAGTIAPDQTVCVRLTTSTLGATAVNATLTVGGVSDTFTSTTQSTAPPPVTQNSSHGGGGAMDWLTLTFLLGQLSLVLGLARRRASGRG